MIGIVVMRLWSFLVFHARHNSFN